MDDKKFENFRMMVYSMLALILAHLTDSVLARIVLSFCVGWVLGIYFISNVGDWWKLIRGKK